MLDVLPLLRLVAATTAIRTLLSTTPMARVATSRRCDPRSLTHRHVAACGLTHAGSLRDLRSVCRDLRRVRARGAAGESPLTSVATAPHAWMPLWRRTHHGRRRNCDLRARRSIRWRRQTLTIFAGTRVTVTFATTLPIAIALARRGSRLRRFNRKSTRPTAPQMARRL
jgi:hypothetical protein